MTETVKYRSVSIVLRQWHRADGRQYWRFVRSNGKRAAFPSLEKAKSEALKEAQSMVRGTLDLAAITGDQSRAIRRMLEADPTCALVDEFLAWHGKRAPKKLVKDAYDDFMGIKDSNAGRSTQNARTLRKHIKPFVDLHGKRLLTDITVTDVESYLTSNPKNQNRTRRNIRGSLVTFFQWCRLREHLPDVRTVAQKAEVPVVSDKIPETYSPAELAVLLEHVRPEFRAWLAIASWAGIRNDEIAPIAGSRKSPLAWTDVNFERKIITVRPETAKMKRRRVIPMCEALQAVLLPLKRENGPVHTAPPPTKDDGKKMRAETARLGAFIGGWRSNALRHSFISFRCAQVGVGLTAMAAGNSEAEVKKSYLDAKSKEEADEWFSVQLGSSSVTP